jgi:hypothetical protein
MIVVVVAIHELAHWWKRLMCQMAAHHDDVTTWHQLDGTRCTVRSRCMTCLAESSGWRR